MNRLPVAALVAFLPACSVFLPPAKPLPAPHTCYRTTGPLLSPDPREGAKWLMLTDSGGDAVGARWYGGRVVMEKGRSQMIRWQSSGPSAYRVSWGKGTLEASEQRGVLSGTARSGARSWPVRALREDCPREG